MIMRKLSLPEWATVIAAGKIEVDPAGYLPQYLKELAGTPFPVELTENAGEVKNDHYWASIAGLCMKWDIERAITNTEAAPKKGGALVLLIPNRPEWALKNLPAGAGEALGMHRAYAIYKLLRG